eukprot:CAMPEP_0172488808 /NCGR_PEP_ID=MMETSP1066-20121228/18532_1 /TAXON_ID=671091 /ORGANISM="Coscinodiscus wailesii, Strain CCMP2513" /LENGTH=307 /DNA_ID=CAMNT_0013256275 /DNA_START=100 /DNA_END=1023 /DNA_ORIENTATION=+
MTQTTKLIITVVSVAAATILPLCSAFTHPKHGVNANLGVLPRKNNDRRINFVNHLSENNRINDNRCNGQLQMVAGAAPTVATIAGAVTGGFMSGGLHAISGPDHLAALIPRCCGQRWYCAGRTGALWGIGHGISATILGLTAFALKNRLTNMKGLKWLLHGASSALEIAVGASLIVIGLLGIKEAREWEDNSLEAQSLSAAAAEPAAKVAGKRAVIFNGLLHGFSWDGAPSLLPAIAVATWKGSVTFLLAYAMGTMATMAIATTIVGEGTRRAGKLLHRPDIPQKLSLVSSGIAIAVGLFWMSLAIF